MPFQHTLSKAQPGHAIAFGLNRQNDEQSLAVFLQRFSSDALLERLIPRLDAAEISATIDHLSSLMRNHLSEQEYHCLFLDD